ETEKFLMDSKGVCAEGQGFEHDIETFVYDGKVCPRGAEPRRLLGAIARLWRYKPGQHCDVHRQPGHYQVERVSHSKCAYALGPGCRAARNASRLAEVKA